jgi:hypothetical protein
VVPGKNVPAGCPPGNADWSLEQQMPDAPSRGTLQL